MVSGIIKYQMLIRLQDSTSRTEMPKKKKKSLNHQNNNSSTLKRALVYFAQTKPNNQTVVILEYKTWQDQYTQHQKTWDYSKHFPAHVRKLPVHCSVLTYSLYSYIWENIRWTLYFSMEAIVIWYSTATSSKALDCVTGSWW